MFQKKIIICAFLIVCNQIISSQNNSGVIIFGNFDYFHLHKKDYKVKTEKNSFEFNNENNDITKPIIPLNPTLPKEPPVIEPPMIPSADPDGGTGNGSGSGSGDGTGGGSDSGSGGGTGDGSGHGSGGGPGDESSKETGGVTGTGSG